MALPSSTRVTASGVVVDNGPRRETRAKVRMVGGWRAAAVTELSLAHLLRFCGGGSRPPQICFRRRCRERQIASCGEPAWPSKLLIYLAPRDRRKPELRMLLYLYSPAHRNPLRRANATGTTQRRYAGLPAQDYRSEPGQSPWHANEAWCERVTLPPSASLAAISLACARKACSRRSAMAAIGRPSARWHERDVIERDLAIASGMLCASIYSTTSFYYFSTHCRDSEINRGR
jgi:hypothetical protein